VLITPRRPFCRERLERILFNEDAVGGTFSAFLKASLRAHLRGLLGAVGVDNFCLGLEPVIHIQAIGHSAILHSNEVVGLEVAFFAVRGSGSSLYIAVCRMPSPDGCVCKIINYGIAFLELSVAVDRIGDSPHNPTLRYSSPGFFSSLQV